MASKPELRQFGSLTRADFDRCPAWIGCHTFDYDEDWYDDTDEETFRPWDGELPVDPAMGMFLVKSSFELRNGAVYTGFITPQSPPKASGLKSLLIKLGLAKPLVPSLGFLQPYLFFSDEQSMPVEYFHTIFTLPDTFNVLVPRNERTMYGLLFRAAWQAIRALARKYWDAEPGVIAVLHTWGQGLWLHPHVHCIVTGGGLSRDRQRWQHSARPGFLFDVAELSGEFRRRFCRLLKRARLTFAGDAAQYADRSAFTEFVDREEARPWVVYCKPPVAGPAKVLEYISRYTHRVALSNRRILDVTDDGTITIDWKDYRDTDTDGTPRHKRMDLTATEFIGRFLRHVLPRRFRKIRFYGIFAGPEKDQKLATCRELLGAELPDTDTVLAALDCWQADDHCPECETGTMRSTTVRLLPERAPPVVHRLDWGTDHVAA